MAARHRSRRRALQVLFEWDRRGGLIDTALQHFYDTLYSEESEHKPKPDKFMEELVRGTVTNAAAIDLKIEEKSENWRLQRMPVVDRTILRLAVYELNLKTLPPPIVIDEALDLARQFSGDESVAFINGVLDAVRRESEASEAEQVRGA
ncbi:MAG TPA: transcription antitermination factor NusB [Bryobacteraceae bacterium]|jgi:N utilization substance protein B|nr:transcription antitermination factor NusB [Bryobacteraceae bacterium]